MPVISALRWREEDQEFKVIVCYEVSLRLAWTVCAICLRNKTHTKGKERGKKRVRQLSRCWAVGLNHWSCS